MKRRQFVRRTTALSLLPAAGCVTPTRDNQHTTHNHTHTHTHTTTKTQTSVNIQNPTPASEATFETWEPNTNCTNDGTAESMHNSEISVVTVTDSISDDYNPIRYSDLPQDQKQILAQVLATGGYATCSTSDAFKDFLRFAVYEKASVQEDDSTVFLEYDDTYYQLYLRQQDQVYAY